MHILASLYDYRTQAKLYETQGGEKASRPCTDNDDLW